MILAADLGTSSLKAGIISHEGQLLARVRIPYPDPPGLGRRDFDALQWELAFQQALKELPASDLTAVALSGNGPTLVPCDSRGEPLAPADLWLQDRSVSVEGQDSYYLPKAAWLKRHDHGTWEKTAMLLSCPEWLQFRLTAKPVMVCPHDDFRRFIWDSRQLEAYGLNSRLFPEIVMMGQRAGYVTSGASAKFSLPEGLPVAAVGSDFMAALLGSGAMEPGMVCDRAGTSEGINYCCESPAADQRLRSLPHAVRGLWNVAAILSSTGAVFEWYRRLTGQADRSYDETLSEVDALSPGRDAPMFFPGKKGEIRWEFGGGCFNGLEPGHGRAEMGRAVMEAIGFGVRRGVELLEASGMPVTEMRVCGGQARGEVWNRMKADITGRRLLIPEIEDAELVGAAACALSALGVAESPGEAGRSLVRIRQVVEPREEVGILYDRAYARYRRAAESLSAD